MSLDVMLLTAMVPAVSLRKAMESMRLVFPLPFSP